MKHKVKFRIVSQGGNKQKYSANVDDDMVVPIDGALLGFESAALFSICVKHSTLHVSDVGFTGGITVNNARGSDFEVRPGDFLQVGNFSVEFLECPHRPKEALSNQTQFLDLSDKARQRDATRVGVSYERTVERAKESEKTKIQSSAARTATSQIPAPTQITKTSSLSKSLDRAEPTRKIPKSGKTFPLQSDQLISWAMLAVGSLVVSFNFNRYVTHSHQQYVAVIYPFILALIISLMVMLKRTSEYLQVKASFNDYLTFFGYVALACIPWSFSFAFDSAMAFFMTVLQLLLVSTAFLIKFNPEIPRFSVVISSWATVFLITGVPLAHYVKQVGKDAPKMVAEAASEENVASNQPAPAPSETSITPIATTAALSPGVPVVVVKPAETLMASAPPAMEKVQDAMANEEYFQAAKSGNIAVIRSLVDRKAVDPNFTLDHGMSGLMYAAANGNMTVLKYLISKKVTINAQDPNGTTALMWAAYKGKSQVVATLLRAGADASIKRDDGDTAFDIAKKWKQHEVAALLQSSSSGAERDIASGTNKRKHRY